MYLILTTLTPYNQYEVRKFIEDSSVSHQMYSTKMT